MADLSFIYGTMESGKTTKLLQDNFNYCKHGHKVVVVKPKLDIKGGEKIINRQNETLKVDILLDKKDSILTKEYLKKALDAKVLLVDEAQFFSHEQIVDFWHLAHIFDIGVICYGLKNDFQGYLFEGTSALLSYADSKTELTTKCECGETAVFNARCVNGKFTIKGDTVAIDGEEDVSYVPLCSDCYLSKAVGKSRISDIIKD